MARKKRTRRIHQDALVRTIAAVLDTGEPTKFRYEGAVRTGLRASMCLEGITWKRADDKAALFVELALARIGAVRPTWAQGQREYRDRAATFCATCGRLLDESRHRFCSTSCRNVAKCKDHQTRAAEDIAAARLAYRAASARGDLPTRDCESCGRNFFIPPKAPTTQYCSHACYVESSRASLRTCPACGGQFKAWKRRQVYCSIECISKPVEGLAPKQCETCGQSFTPLTGRQAAFRRFCCERCRLIKQGRARA